MNASARTQCNFTISRKLYCFYFFSGLWKSHQILTNIQQGTYGTIEMNMSSRIWRYAWTVLLHHDITLIATIWNFKQLSWTTKHADRLQKENPWVYLLCSWTFSLRTDFVEDWFETGRLCPFTSLSIQECLWTLTRVRRKDSTVLVDPDSPELLRQPTQGPKRAPRTYKSARMCTTLWHVCFTMGYYPRW